MTRHCTSSRPVDLRSPPKTCSGRNSSGSMGLGRVIRIEHRRGRVFLSVVRLMLGQFAFINSLRRAGCNGNWLLWPAQEENHKFHSVVEARTTPRRRALARIDSGPSRVPQVSPTLRDLGMQPLLLIRRTWKSGTPLSKPVPQSGILVLNLQPEGRS